MKSDWQRAGSLRDAAFIGCVITDGVGSLREDWPGAGLARISMAPRMPGAGQAGGGQFVGC